MPKVSVIIPTYNRSSLVKDAICSVLAQTELDLEVIVVDDGSTDDTRSVVDNFNDSRIKYYYKQNGGVSSARNFGMAKSEGEYVAFLDSDDIWPENFLEATSFVLDDDASYGLAYTATIQKYEDGGERVDDLSRCVSGWITKHLFKYSTIWPMAVLIHRSVLDGFWFDEGLKICDDNEAFVRLSTRTKFIFVPGVYVTRRFSSDSHSYAAYTDGSYVRALSLERFYFKLGGDKLVPRSVAMKKISHCYRRAGVRHRKQGYRKAAIGFFRRAIAHYPFDLRLYIGLCRAVLLSKSGDVGLDWQMPKELDLPCFAVTWTKGGN